MANAVALRTSAQRAAQTASVNMLMTNNFDNVTFIMKRAQPTLLYINNYTIVNIISNMKIKVCSVSACKPVPTEQMTRTALQIKDNTTWSYPKTGLAVKTWAGQRITPTA